MPLVFVDASCYFQCAIRGLRQHCITDLYIYYIQVQHVHMTLGACEYAEEYTMTKICV